MATLNLESNTKPKYYNLKTDTLKSDALMITEINGLELYSESQSTELEEQELLEVAEWSKLSIKLFKLNT